MVLDGMVLWMVLKTAYSFLLHQPSKFIPPSISFLVWHIFRNKLLTDDNLINRGIVIVSCCHLCGVVVAETTQDVSFE